MTKGKIGPWTVKSATTVFNNPWISVVDHKIVHPNGEAGEYGVVRFKNVAVGVLPVDAEGRVPLVGQHRFPHDRYSWELPEGGGPAGADFLESAKRELAEETGLVAASWAEMIAFDISNSVTDERAVCFYAFDLSEGKAAPEPSEALTIKRVPFNVLSEMVMSGEITDSLTIVMALAARAQALRGEAPAPISDLLLAEHPRK